VHDETDLAEFMTQ
jgi:hypothetical protein